MPTSLESALCSDSAPVTALVSALLDAVPGTHGLRDPMRGGLATALCEFALHTRVGSHRLLARLSGEQLPRIC